MSSATSRQSISTWPTSGIDDTYSEPQRRDGTDEEIPHLGIGNYQGVTTIPPNSAG